jgi:hypothetical protein
MLKVLQERCAYVILRGSTLNNPHLAESYLAAKTTPITSNHAATVRTLVQAYLDGQPGGHQPPIDVLEDDAEG